MPGCRRFAREASISLNVAQVREYLEKHYSLTSGRDTLKLAIKAITETVEAGSKSLELAVVEKDSGLRFFTDAEVDALIAEIDAEKAAADAARRPPAGS